ncbi:hypothetical protein SNOG_05428 [Parastagonospora nodorum SN15]|uniref:Uncharacterized protein n=1 Tax=Phaeosphaeria nodorum (strain SN15 / ATCC MYA-4574 / FGSC 10173) TaxID=321614 RepID=Q0US36_PHANO|nr:hypothetical protein SNOG_05428 [Parastagonospora nodorum SN15]EAT87819.2 hypothetical protein SNOG_05428 [Parastagonospora nodorum SN15]
MTTTRPTSRRSRTAPKGPDRGIAGRLAQRAGEEVDQEVQDRGRGELEQSSLDFCGVSSRLGQDEVASLQVQLLQRLRATHLQD